MELPKWWDKLRMTMPTVGGTSSTRTPEVNQSVDHILRGWDVKNMMWMQPSPVTDVLKRCGGLERPVTLVKVVTGGH